MRFFAGLFVFVLCFLEVVFAVPAPLELDLQEDAKSLSLKKIIPKKSPAKHTVPKKTTPKKTAPKKTTPKKKTAPKKTTPKKTTPKKTTPKKTTPKKTTPKKTTPKKTKPKKKTPPKKTPPKTTCALKKKGPAPKKGPKVKREDVDFGITRRSPSEFLGFHGTSSSTAAQYTSAGRSGKHVPVLNNGFNGNDAELGPGLYVTDHVETAMFFAISAANARKNKGNKTITPSVCMVEAISSADWDGKTPKIWVPPNLVAKSASGKNDASKLKQQEQMAECEGFNPRETVRFSALDITNAAAGKPQVSGNQFAIPTTQFNKIYIRSCMDVTGKTPAQVLAFFQQKGWPQHDFSSEKGKWDIKY